MDYLVAKTKGKRGAFYKVLSDKTTFEDIPDFASSREYDDEYKLQDDEWFVVNQLSQQIYCMDFVKNNFVATNYSFMPKDKYGKIDFIVSVQDEGNVFVFQKITPSYIYEKQKMLSWEHIISPTDQAVLSNHKNVLVIKEGGDCYYIKDTDKLYFTSNPQPIGFSGILLAKRQNSFYCTYFLHNRNVADTKSPYPIKRLEVIRWFNQKSMVFNQSLS